MDESAKIDSVSRCNEGICGKPLLPPMFCTNTWQILREKERERGRGGGGEREIWNDRGGERGEIRERRNIIGRRESPLIHQSREIVQITHWQYDIL